MLERHIHHVATDDPGSEDAAAIRRRLRGVFNPGFGRRATVLGLLIGGVLRETAGPDCDTIVYASAYGETRTLADFLDTFPHASPTMFQASVHPSAVQQVMIDRRQPVREYVPLAGGPNLAARALAAALLAPADPVVFCGGEERGTWLAEHGLGSDRAFAFALVLGRDPVRASCGRLRLTRNTEPAGGASLSFAAWFELLHRRENYAGPVSAEWNLELEWA